MYVSRLDIPWIETSFLLEGLLVSSEEELKTLQDTCRYVYVDIGRGAMPEADFVLEGSAEPRAESSNRPVPYDNPETRLKPGTEVTTPRRPRDKNRPIGLEPVTAAADKSSESPPAANNPVSQRRANNREKSAGISTRITSTADDQPKPGQRRPISKHAAFARARDLSEFNGYGETFTDRHRINYRDITHFTAELETAKTTHERIATDFDSIISDLKTDKSLDLGVMAPGVRDLTNSVIRNPSAMTWVAHIRKLDKYAYSRAMGTSIWCAAFGRHLGLEKKAIETLSLGGLLLDIGKSILPPEFLNLKRQLTDPEIRIMRKHVLFGSKILDEASWGELSPRILNDIKGMVAEHHERANGSGYPAGLENSQISFFGRVAGIVDSFDAMTSESPYTSGPMPPHKAVNELYYLRGDKFQAELVEQFIQAIGIYPPGSLVELNSGEVGVVISVNNLKRLRPTIMLILDANKKQRSKFSQLALDHEEEDVFIARGLSPGAYDIDLTGLFL